MLRNIAFFLFACVVSLPATAQDPATEAILKGLERGWLSAENEADRAHQLFLQLNEHLQQIRLLQMEIQEERRRSTIQSAHQGFPGAQYLAGMLLLEEGGAANETDAALWLHLSAEQGFGDAQVALGNLYRTGVGVSIDPEESARWFQIAADQNHLEGIFLLGIAYRDGIGVIEDPNLASQLIQDAAEQGHAHAQHWTGLAHLLGIGFPVNEEIGIEWIEKAPDSCQRFDSCIYLANLFAFRNENEKAMKYFFSAYDQVDVPNAMITLGIELAEPEGRYSVHHAYMWFYLADKLGDPRGNIKTDSLDKVIYTRQSISNSRRRAYKKSRRHVAKSMGDPLFEATYGQE